MLSFAGDLVDKYFPRVISKGVSTTAMLPEAFIFF
jgi:hypothetical protein